MPIPKKSGTLLKAPHYLDLARKFLKKAIEHECYDYTNHDWCIRYSNSGIIKGTRGLGSWRKSGDHQKYSIIENGQNTHKSPGDLRELAITQTPVKYHQLTLI